MEITDLPEHFIQRHCQMLECSNLSTGFVPTKVVIIFYFSSTTNPFISRNFPFNLLDRGIQREIHSLPRSMRQIANGEQKPK